MRCITQATPIYGHGSKDEAHKIAPRVGDESLTRLPRTTSTAMGSDHRSDERFVLCR